MTAMGAMVLTMGVLDDGRRRLRIFIQRKKKKKRKRVEEEGKRRGGNNYRLLRNTTKEEKGGYLSGCKGSGSAESGGAPRVESPNVELTLQKVG